MGVAQLTRMILLPILFLLPANAQVDEIIFNAESTDYVLEEQPVGTAAVVLEAYYVLYSPFQLGADGIFALDESQPDAAYFTIESAPNADNSLTLGTLRNAAVLDRDGEDAQTVFSLIVTYSTPDGSLTTEHSVSVLLAFLSIRSGVSLPAFLALLERKWEGLVLQAQSSAAEL